MAARLKKIVLANNADLTIHRMVEDVVGCKWSLAILARVRDGVNRPGAIEHSIPGLSTKVMNERLRKLMRFGLLGRTRFEELPPRVEYQLTGFGGQFVQILDQIAALRPQAPSPFDGEYTQHAIVVPAKRKKALPGTSGP